jgi:hypothetical protein
VLAAVILKNRDQCRAGGNDSAKRLFDLGWNQDE